MKYYFNIFMLIIGGIAGCFICEKFQPEANVLFKERIIRDTIINIKASKPVIIKSKPKIIYRTDSVFISRPFVVELDTVFIKDTIKINYYYPENDLFLSLKRSSDTIKIPQINTIRIQKERWWIKPVIFITGAVSGYLLKK